MSRMKKSNIILFILCCMCFLVLGDAAQVKAASPNEETCTVLLGETFSLKIDTKKEVSYYSSNKSVVRVNQKGKARALKKGTATVSATYGKKTYYWNITVTNKVDVIVFAGQSNMAGQGGLASEAPELIQGAGYECKAVTDPTQIVPITEPFGLGQDTPLMNDAPYRNGTLVTSFVNAYYKQTKVPVVGVSVTRVGTTSNQWNESYYTEVISRYKKACAALKERGIKVRKKYMVFFQGESDALIGNTAKTYKKNTISMFDKVQRKTKIEKCFLIRIGTLQSDKTLFDDVSAMQTKMCKVYKDFVLVSTKANALSKKHYQSDGLHINQQGLNKIGKEAGTYTGKYANTGKEPAIKDIKNGNTYKARKIQN